MLWRATAGLARRPRNHEDRSHHGAGQQDHPVPAGIQPAQRAGRGHRHRRSSALALLAILFFGINDLLVDRLWFASQHQLPVWDLRTFGRILLWIPISIVAFVLMTLSVWLAVSTAGDAAPPVTRIRTPLRASNGLRGYQTPGCGGRRGGGAAHPR